MGYGAGRSPVARPDLLAGPLWMPDPWIPGHRLARMAARTCGRPRIVCRRRRHPPRLHWGGATPPDQPIITLDEVPLQPRGRVPRRGLTTSSGPSPSPSRSRASPGRGASSRTHDRIRRPNPDQFVRGRSPRSEGPAPDSSSSYRFLHALGCPPARRSRSEQTAPPGMTSQSEPTRSDYRPGVTTVVSNQYQSATIGFTRDSSLSVSGRHRNPRKVGVTKAQHDTTQITRVPQFVGTR